MGSRVFSGRVSGNRPALLGPPKPLREGHIPNHRREHRRVPRVAALPPPLNHVQIFPHQPVQSFLYPPHLDLLPQRPLSPRLQYVCPFLFWTPRPRHPRNRSICPLLSHCRHIFLLPFPPDLQLHPSSVPPPPSAVPWGQRSLVRPLGLHLPVPVPGRDRRDLCTWRVLPIGHRLPVPDGPGGCRASLQVVHVQPRGSSGWGPVRGGVLPLRTRDLEAEDEVSGSYWLHRKQQEVIAPYVTTPSDYVATPETPAQVQKEQEERMANNSAVAS
mmetsp:Transcript_5126/g.8846  ORF Transcript_5126/g.8846 Transcript_5126/m.8846 type:complete len:272 (-) Transcript_5126:221-1036(-)